MVHASAFSADFLRSILDSLPLMVFVKDAVELRFELLNRAGEELLGRTQEELIGRTDRDFFAAEEADFFIRKDREALASANAVEVSEEPITTQHGVRWLRTMKMAVRDESGVARHLLGISEDITARRELAQRLAETENKLRHAQKMDEIGKLVGGAAHDFNNQLGVIIMYADVALQNQLTDLPVDDEVAEIRRAAGRAADLTRQLLAFTRHGALAPPQVLDLNDVIRSMVKMLRRVLEEDIELVTVLAPSLGKVLANSTPLEQMIMNLTVNARDAMPDGGKLVLETANVDIDEAFIEEHPGARLGPHVMLSLSDTGAGMSRETVARIFEPFFTTKPVGQGTGLGLWNVYGIIRQLGGTVWVYSELGLGTTFKVYLPCTDAVAPAQVSRMPAPAAVPLGAKETILVVEDDEQLLRVVTSVLHRNGYKVLGARSPADALVLSEQHAGDIELLLTDVVMPLLSGKQLADRLAATRPTMKVVFMSGYTANAMDQKGVLEKGFVLIPKPFSTATLLDTIRAVLAPSPT